MDLKNSHLDDVKVPFGVECLVENCSLAVGSVLGLC